MKSTVQLTLRERPCDPVVALVRAFAAEMGRIPQQREKRAVSGEFAEAPEYEGILVYLPAGRFFKKACRLKAAIKTAALSPQIPAVLGLFTPKS